MRTSSVVLAVAVITATPSFAAPVPIQARAALGKEIADFFAGIVGSITGKAAVNTALGNNVDGSAKTRREIEQDLVARAGAAGLLKPLLTSAASSAAVAGFFGAIGKLFGGDDAAAQRREVDQDLVARAGAAGLLKPLLTSAASSAAVAGFFGAIGKLFGGGDDAAQRRGVDDLESVIAAIEGSGEFTQEQLDEVESELEKAFAAVPTRRDLSTRAPLALGGLTKGLVGIIGSIAGSLGVGALLGGDDKAARDAPLTVDDIVAQIEGSDAFTQDQLDEVEAELTKAMAGGLIARSDMSTRAIKLGGLTKGLVGIIGSIAGSLGVGALLGGNDKAARSFEGLNALE